MTEIRFAEIAAEKRRHLADQLTNTGDLVTAEWRECVESVPREVFLGDLIYRRRDRSGGTWWEPVLRENVEPLDWLDLAYQNQTWVTQVDGKVGTSHDPLQGSPTSSSTLPGLVVRMLEHAAIEDGHNVLEIGTGTGYSAALLTHRLSGSHVTSVEVDPVVAARAEAALTVADRRPTLITDDGLNGYAEHSPYDRIIATCAVKTVPPAWLRQVRPGGYILATLGGWLYGSGLALLRRDGDSATGHFLPGAISFMLARAHTPPPITGWPRRIGDTRRTDRGGDLLDDWMGSFLAQLAAPHTRRVGFLEHEDRPPTELLVDHATGSYAWLVPMSDGAWHVTQAGPVRLWDDIEDAVRVWKAAGEPEQSTFGVIATPDGLSVTMATPGYSHRWTVAGDS